MEEFFWRRIHISDESASLRWALSLFAVIALYPTLGSLVDVILIAMAVFSLNYWIFDKVHVTRTDRLVLMIVLAYLVISIFAPLLHDNPLEGFLFGLSNSGLIMLVLLIPVFRHCGIAKHRDLLISAFPAAGIIMFLGLLSEASFVDVLSRAELNTGNSLILAFLAGCTLLGCVVYGFAERKRRLIFFIAGFAFAIPVLMLTGSRAPIVTGITFALGYLAFAAIGTRNPKVLVFFALLLPSAILGAVFAKDVPAVKYLTERSTQLVEDVTSGDASFSSDESTRMRVGYYTVGLNMFLEKPLFGHGRKNVMKIAQERAPEGEKRWFQKTHLHSGYLTELAGTGLAGLISLLAVMAIPILVSWKGNKTEVHFAVLFTLFFGFYGLTNISFYHDVMVMSFVAYTLLISSLAHRSEQIGD